MVIKNKVSVVIPFYGSFDINRALTSMQSCLTQTGIDYEVVVAEENPEPILADKIPKGVKYFFTKRAAGHNFFQPGVVRNLAIRNCEGEFVYNNDGDIVFLNSHYLAELANLARSSERVALYRPPMRRLPVECFKEFSKLVEEKGLAHALTLLDMSEDYLAKTLGSDARMKVFRKIENGKEKIFLYTEVDHQRYLSDPANRGREPFFSTLDVHAGGTLMRRSQFEHIGGYCTLFSAWGCHDADLQWKLRGLFDLQQIPKEPRFEVLHLDHPREYFLKEVWQRNRDIQNARKAEGVKACVGFDRGRITGGINNG